MKSWRDVLSTGEAEAMASIVEQIPPTMGFRMAFEGMLDKLASSAPKYRYIFLSESGELTGSNDADMAERASESDDETEVLDVQTGEFLTYGSFDEQEDLWAEDEDEGDEGDDE